MNALVPVASTQLAERPLDAERLIERWKEGRSKETLKAYTDDLAHFSKWSGAPSASIAVDQMMRSGQGPANETARAYRSAMVDDGFAPNTINRRLAALRSLIALGKEFAYIPWELSIKNLRVTKYRDTRGPGSSNIKRLIHAATAHENPAKAARDGALVWLLYGRGLRRAEVAKLDLADWDVRDSRVYALRKGKREKEWLVLSKQSNDALKSWLKHRGRKPGPLFFNFHRASGEGQRLTADGMHDLLAKLGTELDITVRPHGLRHAAITRIVERTGDVVAAQQFAGHAGLNTTMEYLKNLKDKSGEMAQLIADSLDEV